MSKQLHDEGADLRYEERRLAYLEAEIAVDRPLGNGRAEAFQQLARLALGRGPLNEELLRASIELVNARRDCADFALAGLLRMLYQYRASPLLSPQLLSEVERAARGFCYWYDQPGVRGMCFHTENHQILFHSAELLAGQLFRNDALPNSGHIGAWHAAHGAELVRQWLDQRARFGFSEWLSNCYFEEDALALLNLYDFAEDADLRRRAGMMLDMIMLEMALHSYKGVLASTHGRTYARWIKGGRGEPTAAMAWLLFGQGQLDLNRGGSYSGANLAMATFAASAYRCPPLIRAIAHYEPDEIYCRERHGLDVAEAPRYGLRHERVADNMFFWACQTSRHPAVRATALEVARIADDPWLVDFVEGVDAPLEACRNLIEDAGGVFDGDAVNTALSAADLVTYRTPHYQLSCAQDFRPGKPGYQQHPWHAALGLDAVIFTSHPGTDDESGEHTARPNFWAGNRWLPRAAQHRNVLVCIHHVPQDDPRPFSHAYFPRRAFDEVDQRGHWTFGRKGGGFVGLYSQRPARWATEGPYADVELRADASDNIWLCEMGDERLYPGFAQFIEALSAATVECDGLSVRYDSPSLGAVSFGWTGPLRVSDQSIALHNYPRFDNPVCQAQVGERRYVIAHAGEQLVLDFRLGEEGNA
jgi:hypothetical protein